MKSPAPPRLAYWLIVLSLVTSHPAPAQLVTNGLRVWLRADALTGYADGDTVTNWPDSAVGFIPGDAAQNAVLTPGGGVGPYPGNDPAFVRLAVGGKPGVHFDGGDVLSFAGSLGLATNEGGQAFTVFAVGINSNGPVTLSSAFSFGAIDNGGTDDGDGGASVKCEVGTNTGATVGSGLRFNDGRCLFDELSFAAAPYRIGMWRLGAGMAYSNGVFRRDGLASTQAPDTAGATNTINLRDEGYHLGAGISGASGALTEFMAGTLAEVLLYTRALDDAEANRVGRYLETKYGLLTAYAGPQADPRPNVLIVLLDDMGWSDLGCYGGEVRTPAVDRLAAQGLRFRAFHTTARCSPTRASLMTGQYSHRVAQAPGDPLPDLVTTNNITIAELLRANGYRTYMTGKWHLGEDPAETPWARGFQHVLGLGASGAGAGVDYWLAGGLKVTSTADAIPARTYGTNAYDFYQPDGLGDYAIDFLNHHLAQEDGAPFFLYMAFQQPHFNIEAPAALAEATPPGGTSYVAIASQGWDAVRSNRYARMLSMGVIDAARYPLTPRGDSPFDISPYVQPIPAWSTLGADRRADLARRMALYMAMIDKVDQNVGRVLDRLRETERLDNTIVFYLSDNGATAEGGVYGSAFGEYGHAPLTGAQLANMAQPFQNDGIWLGGGWANVNNTPFRLYKRYSHEGGTRAPLVVFWPAGITNAGRWTDQQAHVIDILPTIAEATGCAYPAQFNGHPVHPFDGRSLLPTLRDEARVPRQLGFEHEYTRAFVDGDTKFVTKTFPSTDGTAPTDLYELYDLAADPVEQHNLAAQAPELLYRMVTNWNAWAAAVGVPPDRWLAADLTAPAPIGGDLFVDTFDRSYGTNIDASAAGMSGSRVPPVGMNATYYEGYEGAAGPAAIQVYNNRLQLGLTAGMAESGLMHNFIGQDILDAGGFSVEMRVHRIESAYTDTSNRYAGFGVGLSPSEAARGGDIGSTNSFRGRATGTPVRGCSAFFVELDLDGYVQVWTNGVRADRVAVGTNAGTLTAAFDVQTFAAGGTVTARVFFDGLLLDIDSASPTSVTRTFRWNRGNLNYVGLSGRATGLSEVDNIAVRTLPVAGALALSHATRAGLTGSETAPGADPDGDGAPNVAEWATGGDPHIADSADIRALIPVAVTNDAFLVDVRRRRDYAESGIGYAVLSTTNLTQGGWALAPATLLGTTAIPGAPGYEYARMALALMATQGTNGLFTRIRYETLP